MGLVDQLGGQYEANSLGIQGQAVMDQLAKQYPQLVGLIDQYMPQIEQAKLDAAKQVTPGYNDLAVGEVNRLAPSISAAQGKLDAGQAAADIANLNTYGTPAGAALRSTAASSDPEYFNTLNQLGGKYGDLLSSISPNLSGAKRAEVERGTSRLTAGGADNSAVSTAEKAMDFGSAHDANVNNFANVVNSVASNLGNLKTGLNPVNTALGRDSRSAPVAGAITPVTKPGAEAFQIGGNQWQGLLGAQMANEQIAAGKFKSWGDSLNQDSQTFANIAGAVGGSMA